MPMMPAAQVIAQTVAMAQLYDSTLGAAAPTFDVQNISQAYNHLLIKGLWRADVASTGTRVHVRFNNDSGANYDMERAWANNAVWVVQEALAQTSAEIAAITAASDAAGLFAQYTLNINSYKDTVAEKMISSTGVFKASTAAADTFQWWASGFWRSTAAINRITFLPTTGNFIAGSRLTIYGLL